MGETPRKMDLDKVKQMYREVGSLSDAEFESRYGYENEA